MHRLMWQFQANDFRKQASSGGCVANIGNVRTASRLLLLLFASLAGGLHPRSIHGQVMPTPLIARPQPVRQVVSIGTAITPDSSHRTRHMLVGAIVGAATGAAIGYGLAILAHLAFCEGAQCDQPPNRAIRESTRAGTVVGASVGAIVGWRW